MLNSKNREILMVNIWKENPIFRQILGVCSCLAVTNLVVNTLVMCIALTLVTACSNVLISLLRHRIPSRIRIITQMLVVATFVTMVDQFLKGFFYEISKQMGAYIGLIITNCIVMGRCEVFAMQNDPIPSFWDGIGAGLGYSLVLLTISVPREILGFGSVAGFPILQTVGIENWIPWNIMIMPSGAFLVLGIFIWIANSVGKKVE